MFLFNGDWTIRSNSTWSKKKNNLCYEVSMVLEDVLFVCGVQPM